MYPEPERELPEHLPPTHGALVAPTVASFANPDAVPQQCDSGGRSRSATGFGGVVRQGSTRALILDATVQSPPFMSTVQFLDGRRRLPPGTSPGSRGCSRCRTWKGHHGALGAGHAVLARQLPRSCHWRSGVEPDWIVVPGMQGVDV